MAVGNRDDGAVLREIAEATRFDAVVDFLAFRPEQVQTAIDAFTGRIGQYLFISSTSAYEKPVANYLITEATPLPESILGLRAPEDRLRGAARAGAAGDRFPGDGRASVVHLRPDLDPVRLRRPGLHRRGPDPGAARLCATETGRHCG